MFTVNVQTDFLITFAVNLKYMKYIQTPQQYDAMVTDKK